MMGPDRQPIWLPQNLDNQLNIRALLVNCPEQLLPGHSPCKLNNCLVYEPRDRGQGKTVRIDHFPAGHPDFQVSYSGHDGGPLRRPKNPRELLDKTRLGVYFEYIIDYMELGVSKFPLDRALTHIPARHNFHLDFG